METLLEKSLNKHDFPEKERRELAKEGEALLFARISITLFFFILFSKQIRNRRN